MRCFIHSEMFRIHAYPTLCTQMDLQMTYRKVLWIKIIVLKKVRSSGDIISSQHLKYSRQQSNKV